MPETVILPPLSKDFSGLKNAKPDYQSLQDVLINMGRNYKEPKKQSAGFENLFLSIRCQLIVKSRSYLRMTLVRFD
jgi:hypothetical protein